MEKAKISHSQFYILIITFEIGTSILLDPFLLTVVAKQNAWICILIGLCIGLPLIGIYAVLIRRYSNLTIIEMNEKILGKWAGKCLSLLFFIYFFIMTAGLLKIIGDFITSEILPETPIVAIEIVFMSLVVYGTRIGLETFSRTSEMVFPWILMFFLLLIVFLFPEFHFKNLFPLMDDGIQPIIKASFITLGVPFADIIIFLMITPCAAPNEKLGKILFISTLAGGTIIFVFVVMSLLVLGPGLTSRLNYPIYVLAQEVNVGDFIQRIEVFSGGIIFISIFVKITICFYSLSLSLAQILNLKEYKILTFPFGILVILFANLMSPNIIFFQSFLFSAWTPVVLLYGLLFPLLLLGIDSIKLGFMKRKNKLWGSR